MTFIFIFEVFLCFVSLICVLEKCIFPSRRSYASAVLEVEILSVCLSHACFVTNPKNLPAIFFIPYERAILLVFCHPTVVGGRRPLPPIKWAIEVTHPLQKSLTATDFRL